MGPVYPGYWVEHGLSRDQEKQKLTYSHAIATAEVRKWGTPRADLAIGHPWYLALTCYLRRCHGSPVQELDFVFKIALVSEKVRAHCKVTVCDISSAIKLSSVISSAPIFLQLLMILKFNRLHHNNRNELLGHNDLLPGRYSCSQQVAISFRPVPIWAKVEAMFD